MINIKVQRSGNNSPNLFIEVTNEFNALLVSLHAPDKVAWTALAKWCEQKALESR